MPAHPPPPPTTRGRCPGGEAVGPPPPLGGPFDPAEVLGIPSTVVLTPLANLRVIHAVAERLGFKLSDEDAQVALRWVKQTCYEQTAGTLDDAAFAAYIRASEIGKAM